jgi:hypothetical protein
MTLYLKILVALDGSEYASAGGEIALHLAQNTAAQLVVSHIYNVELHSRRFRRVNDWKAQGVSVLT